MRRDLREVAQERHTAWEHGYAPVPLFWHGYADPKEAGKAPMHARWPSRALRGDFAHTSPSALLANTGLVASPGGACFTDRDLDLADIAEAVEEIERECLGATITRRRANSSRSACAYRADPTDPPINRIIDGARGRIEVLAQHRQLAALGIHPSGVAIQWPIGGPLDLPLKLLPAVSQHQMARYLAAIAPLLGTHTHHPCHDVQHSADTAKWAGTDLARLASAVMAIPVDGLHRTDWIKVRSAIHLATGGSDDGLALFDTWSAQSPFYDRAGLERAWNSPIRDVSPSSVFWMARAQGWQPPPPTPPTDWEAARPPVGVITPPPPTGLFT
jgi:hypothetical protein